MSTPIPLKAGERTKIFRLFSSSVPSTINFTAQAEGADVSGTVEVARWHWFSWKHETLPLKAQNAIEKGFADADFVIHVTADQDCEVTFARKGAGKGFWLVIGLAVGIVVLAAAMVLFTAPPPGG
ncbi:hypothetical protein [Gymnodinialimonas sp.]